MSAEASAATQAHAARYRRRVVGWTHAWVEVANLIRPPAPGGLTWTPDPGRATGLPLGGRRVAPPELACRAAASQRRAIARCAHAFRWSDPFIGGPSVRTTAGPRDRGDSHPVPPTSCGPAEFDYMRGDHCESV